MLEIICNLAKQAGTLFGTAQPEQNSISTKEGRGNYVTTYDKKVQNFLYSELSKSFPGCSFSGEEDDLHPESLPELCFIIDPIDGTANFINGYHHSAVSIACAKEGRIVYGAVYDPYFDELFYASSGGGAFVNGRRLHIPDCPLEESIVLFGASSYSREGTERTFRILRNLFDCALDVRNSGSAALDLCYVAAGRAGAFFELKLSPWDYAAAGLILEEAGGVIRTCEGGQPSLTENSSIAAAGPTAYHTMKQFLT